MPQLHKLSMQLGDPIGGNRVMHTFLLFKRSSNACFLVKLLEMPAAGIYHVIYKRADIILILGKHIFEQILNGSRLVVLVCKQSISDCL